ncbi:MAG TPA: CSLREA domain-containing protein [Acidimicrobiales bacterium]|jgi:CSLREA domain-containing protein
MPTRTGMSRIAPIGISLVSGLAMVASYTIATAVGAAPAGAAGTSLQSLQKTPQLVPQTGQPLATGKGTHVGEAAPAISSTPHLIPHTAVNQTFTVNTNNDTDVDPSNSTTCQDSDGNCSLRAAIEAANNDYPNVDQINVPDGSDIQLTEADVLEISNSMFISGVGSGAAPIVDGLNNTEVFYLSGNDSIVPAVELTNLTIQNGSADYGANIYVGDSSDFPADLTLSGVTVTGGTATDYGGGIYVDEDSSLWTDSGTTISNNQSGDCGGGISNGGINDGGGVVISGSTISGNSAGCGGGIYNVGALSLDAAQINNNGAVDGGAIYNEWSLSDNGSSYSGNDVGTSTASEDDPEGGVLWNDDSASLSNVTVTGTQMWAIPDGTDEIAEGGVFYNDWQMSLTNISVSNTTNRADGDELLGGIVANQVYDCCPSDGVLSINGLTVSGTSNGASGVDTTIGGGILFNDWKASVNGLNVSSTTNNVGEDSLYGGVGDTDFLQDTTDECGSSCPPNLDGSTPYQNVTVNGTTNNAPDDGSIVGGVFALDYDFYSDAPLQGDVSGATITGTTDSIGTNGVEGGVVATFSSMNLNNVSIDSTTVNAAGGDVYGGAVGSFNEDTYPTMSATDVSVTNTTISDIGNGDGFVEGGGWFASADLNATGLQVLDTSITADDEALGGALADDDEGGPGSASNLTNSTFARTTANLPAGGTVGGVFILNTAQLTNVTVDDNTSTGSSSEGADAAAFGGFPVNLTNDTIANNTVGGGGDVAGISAMGVINFKNTIVQTDGAPNCEGGTFTSAGGNLEAGGNTCNFNAPSDQTNVGNPMVSQVADNSGPVQTAALQPGSPAIGKGVSAGCPSTDARGVARPAGNCDVGAFQLSKQGYWMVAADGGIFNFANAGFYGSMGGTALNSPVVGMAATPDGKGYWEVAADGGIFNFGDANYYGSMGGKHLNKPIVGMAATPDGGGYWEVASDGGIFSFGDAHFYGSTGSIHLNKPVVGMAAAPNGNGYWLVASDGGIFNYGSGAGFLGSAGSIHLNKPVVGMAAAPNGNGYWLVASDGGIFTYGTGVNFYGSTGSIHLNKPVVGMAATPSGGGYWLFASDGGVFNYGDATFQGSMGGTPLVQPVVGGAANSIE